MTPAGESAEQRSADEDRLREYADALAQAIDAAVPGWITASIIERCAGAGIDVDAALRAEAEAAGRRCLEEVSPAIAELLRADLDDQRSTPLALLRSATRHATEVLRSAGVPPVERDEFARRSFPDDVYDLVPATLSDVDQRLHEPGLVWGAAKAHVHMARRRADGAR